ncbi:uncharacterized protein LOC143281335 isoform X2 [Babylonia areolata]|uniref:uncharacterized protein LOC143281335 isoform X2 n=1 Tax=Babylonia areolata TaxID=304850 RepID=UPI003FCF388F
MDHMYAATSPRTGADVEITPPPFLSTYLKSRDFAHTSPERPSTSHQEDLSPRTTRSAARRDEPLETRQAVKQQELSPKTRKSATRQEQQPADTKGSARQKQSAKIKKVDTNSDAEPDQPPETRSKASRQQNQTKKAESQDTKQDLSLLTRKTESKQDQAKKTEQMDTKQPQEQETRTVGSKQQPQTKPKKMVTRLDQSPEIRNVSKPEDQTRQTRSLVTRQTPERKTKMANTEDDVVETRQAAVEKVGHEDTKKLSNGKDTEPSEAAANSPLTLRKRGRQRKQSLNSLKSTPSKESGKDIAPEATVISTPDRSDIPEDSSLQMEKVVPAQSSASPLLSASARDLGGSCTTLDVHVVSHDQDNESPEKGGKDQTEKNTTSKQTLQRKEKSTTQEQDKANEHSHSGGEAPSGSQTVSQLRILFSAHIEPFPVQTAGQEPVRKPDSSDCPEGAADTPVAQGSGLTQDSSLSGADDGRIPASDSAQSKHPDMCDSDDSNNNTSSLQSGEVKSSHSTAHSPCSSSEPVEADGNDSKAPQDSSEPMEVDDSGDRQGFHGSPESKGKNDAKSSSPFSPESVDKSGGDEKTTAEQSDTVKTETQGTGSESMYCTQLESSAPEGERREDVVSGSSKQTARDASATVGDGQPSARHAEAVLQTTEDSDMASVTLRNICEAVRLKRKSPERDSSSKVVKAAPLILRKRKVKEAGLDSSSSDPFPSSQLSDASPYSSRSLTSILSSTSSASSPVSQSSSKSPAKFSKKKASVPKADPRDLPCGLEKYRIPLRDHGWKRELVVRGTYDEIKCKFPPADVYYFTPEGRKLRSGVQIASFLSEKPGVLTADNFTFMKKTIWEEPWETVRQAGSSRLGRRSGSSSKTLSPLKKVKVKAARMGSSIVSMQPESSDTARQSPPQPKSAPTSGRSKHRSFLHLRCEDSDTESETDDEDYDPWKEESSPDWNKRRTFVKHKGSKQPKLKHSPEREVLIQSLPEPDIIIDRADESLYAGAVADKTDGFDSGGDRRVGGAEEGPKTPRMMLLPADIKEELVDSEGEGEDDVGTVHIHRSPQMPARPLMKPTARKSTMPRIKLKKPSSSSKSRDNTLLMEGQLCSNACPGLNGVAPSLQCCVCMCLFHHQCVNVNPAYTLPGAFKCLRCKDVATSDSPACSVLTTRPPVSASSTVPTPTSTTPSSTAPPPPRVIVVRAPLAPPPGGSLPSLQTAPSPLITTAPTPLVSAVRSDGRRDAIQLLRNLTTLAQSSSTAPGAIPVRHAPSTPPQLVKGVTTTTSTPGVGSVRYCVIPPLQARPPPRLTAAPGVVVVPPAPPRPPPPPPSTALPLTVLPPSAHTVCLPVSGSGVPQPQMMTLPASLLGRLNLNQPLALKLNNAQVVVPPSCLISTKEGLKVLLPPSTFPVPPNTNTKLAATVCNNMVTTATPLPPANTTAASRDSQAGGTEASVSTASLLSHPTSAIARALSSSAGAIPFCQSGDIGIASASGSAGTCQDSDSGNTLPVSTAHSPPSTHSVSTKKRQGDEGGSRVRHCRSRRAVAVTQCAIHRLHGGFDCMLAIFRFLSIPDLLRAGQVCQTWQKIAQERCLWQKVNLKGLRIRDWGRAARFLACVRTRSLNLLKVQPESEVHEERMKFWDSLRDCVNAQTELRCLQFGLVPAYVLHSVAESLTHVEVLHAEHISDFSQEDMWTTWTKLDVGRFGRLTRLQELRLSGVSSLALPSFTFSGSLPELASLKHLHTLSLTSVCALRDSEFSFLADMKQLRVLELGECLQWTEETYRAVGELCNLQHLRLECGGEIPDCGLGDAVSKLTKLQRLELILFTIPATLERALSHLPHLDTLVVWPNAYHGLSPALVNSHALAAVVGLQGLRTLEWGVVVRPSSSSPSIAPPSSPPFPAVSIPLLRPGATLDPEMETCGSDVIHVTVNDFTQRLLLSLPETTCIKVFNTQVVGRDSS